MHPAALSVPLFVTAPKKPAAHVVQAATETLPTCRAVVVIPVGQAVQLEPEAVAEEYVPAAQATQPVALAVPLPVMTPAKPGAQ